ncbi:MAG: hypothetical protein WA705_01630 [Candidatus Ozemobacteraceae bacterium]
MKPGRNENSRGITLVEILAALFLLAVSVIPMIGVIGTGAADTEILQSSLFAQNAARGILETILESLPFELLQTSETPVSDLDGGPAETRVGRLVHPNNTDPSGLLSLVGNPGNDDFIRGTLRDERGTFYKVTLFVFPVPAVNQMSPGNASTTGNSKTTRYDDLLTFSFIPRPPFEHARDERGHPTWYSSDPFVGKGVPRPYDLPVATITRTAEDLGVPLGPDPRFPRCLMKKLLLRIRWTPHKGPERTMELVTAKADLSKTGNGP